MILKQPKSEFQNIISKMGKVLVEKTFVFRRCLKTLSLKTILLAEFGRQYIVGYPMMAE